MSEQKRAHERERQLYSKPETTNVLRQASGFTYGSASGNGTLVRDRRQRADTLAKTRTRFKGALRSGGSQSEEATY